MCERERGRQQVFVHTDTCTALTYSQLSLPKRSGSCGIIWLLSIYIFLRKKKKSIELSIRRFTEGSSDAFICVGFFGGHSLFQRARTRNFMKCNISKHNASKSIAVQTPSTKTQHTRLSPKLGLPGSFKTMYQLFISHIIR